MKTNSILILFLILALASCSPRLSSDYLHDFYKARQDQMIHLVDGDRAPLIASDLKTINYFPYNEMYRVAAKFSKAEKIDVFDMATYSGKTKEFAKIGTLSFRIKNRPLQIHVYQSVRYANHPIYGQQYFIPFNDLTNSDLTYGGGRYIDIDKNLFESNKVILDFNQAYNPWCAYSDGYNCPVPPKENSLEFAIHAGEKLFHKEETH